MEANPLVHPKGGGGGGGRRNVCALYGRQLFNFQEYYYRNWQYSNTTFWDFGHSSGIQHWNKGRGGLVDLRKYIQMSIQRNLAHFNFKWVPYQWLNTTEVYYTLISNQ